MYEKNLQKDTFYLVHRTLKFQNSAIVVSKATINRSYDISNLLGNHSALTRKPICYFTISPFLQHSVHLE